MSLQLRYKATVALFVACGISAEIFLICSASPILWLLPLILFALLGLLIRCPECKLPIGCIGGDVGLPLAVEERCSNCGQWMPNRPLKVSH
jgi:hypothetical protein